MGVVSVTTMILAAALAERAQSERRPRQSEEELRAGRDHLEVKVQERPQQLRASNEALRAEIAERRRTESQLRQTYAELASSHEELKAAQWRLIQAEKMETVGRLAAGLLNDMSQAIHRADAVVKELMDFSASQELQVKGESLNAIIERTLQMIRHALAVNRVRVGQELQEKLPALRLDRNRKEGSVRATLRFKRETT